ncbi:group I truncated hemoglobin [Pseudomarimonas salicorniae]|uniref:Group 1 truncated hemoglobin n=1 Tax=Pseudomarimonas salicorniae TaxID=2933270 RepID=A0ABT0GLZ0_9GAMM|nr:group 1 truncated hemoglobin [Lysobacter sp. CAU 1642]MCK7595229.1 group 1 truncated hemoglobin [Lysobacter sp. CAU 1642]
MRSTRLALAILLGAVLASACATREPRSSDSLYREVGGAPGVERLVERLLDRVHENPRISGLFANSDRADLQRLIEEQFCAEFGGGCTYTGRSMEESHSGLGINHAEFEVFVEDLILAMEDVGLATPTQNRILRIFAPMRDEVVDR